MASASLLSASLLSASLLSASPRRCRATRQPCCRANGYTMTGASDRWRAVRTMSASSLRLGPGLRTAEQEERCHAGPGLPVPWS
jgi:hypothetical protein